MSTTKSLKETLGFGRLLRQWRQARGMRTPELRVGAPPLLTMRLRKDDLALAFFPTITTLASPQDVTLAQLRIECVHPADTATEQMAARLAAAALA